MDDLGSWCMMHEAVEGVDWLGNVGSDHSEPFRVERGAGFAPGYLGGRVVHGWGRWRWWWGDAGVKGVGEV